MVDQKRLICDSRAVVERGTGFCFSVTRFGREVPAFVIRFNGRVYAYVNECAHVPVELNCQPGEFFDYSKLYLICSMHGALYSPETGQCLGGRCHGRGLKPLMVCEMGDKVFLEQSDNG